jgi:hypothetical protein
MVGRNALVFRIHSLSLHASTTNAVGSSDSLSQVIDKGLAEDIGERYATVGALLTDVENWMQTWMIKGSET